MDNSYLPYLWGGESSLETIMVISNYQEALELLERRIGGLVKGMAKVKTCRPGQIDWSTSARIFICYGKGDSYRCLHQRIKSTDRYLMGAELILLPAGVKKLRAEPKETRLGVVAAHLPCANHFFGEIVRSGIVEYQFEVGGFQGIPEMRADKFVVSEELEPIARGWLGKLGLTKELIPLPRTLSPRCAAEIVNTTLEVLSE